MQKYLSHRTSVALYEIIHKLTHTHSGDNLNNDPKVFYGNISHYYIF